MQMFSATISQVGGRISSSMAKDVIKVRLLISWLNKYTEKVK